MRSPSSPPTRGADLIYEAAFAREHRMIEDLVELLYARHREGAEHAELLRILKELESCTTEHFRSEEAYMASVDYSGLLAHQRIHRQLLCELARQRASYTRTGGPLPAKLLNFVQHWLVAHMEGGQVKQRGIAAMSRLG